MGRGIPKVVGIGRNRRTLRNIMQCSQCKRKAQGGGNQYGISGIRGYKVRETGCSDVQNRPFSNLP